MYFVILPSRPRSAHGTSLCPSNTGARFSAASAVASGDFCAAAGVETRARAARPASRDGLFMARDPNRLIAGCKAGRFCATERPRHLLLTQRREAPKPGRLSLRLFARLILRLS